MIGTPKDLLAARFKYVSRQLECENALSGMFMTIMKNNDLVKFLPLAKSFSNLPHECTTYNPRELTILTSWDLVYPYVLGDSQYDATYEDQYRTMQYKASIHLMIFDRSNEFGLVTTFDYRDQANNLTARMDCKASQVKNPTWFRPLLLNLLNQNKTTVPANEQRILARQTKLKGRGVMAGMEDWARDKG